MNPEAVGWSRHPVHVCNLRGFYPRKKKWDYWCIVGDRFLFSTTIAHIDYLSVGALYFLEYASNRYAEHVVVKPFARTPIMPETVEGSIQFEQKDTRIAFESAETTVRLSIHADSFAGQPLDAAIEIVRPAEHETLNVVIPWSPTRFQFTSKQHCLPSRGTIRWGNETFELVPDAAFACLDFGRGIWPYRTTWNWAAFSGYSGSDVIGVNMGAKWTDNTGMNENGILLNGRLYKLFDEVAIEYDCRDFMRPWRMNSESSDAIRLTFVPFFERADDTNLFVVRSTTHQTFGRYQGTIRVEDRTIPVDGIVGWAEEHRARW
ncbi:MAG: DUF2804 domain-containing protein [Candidatus Hydrogenedentes bacterium]|nr:DUF2804 domain-containing protein [Candidatus Hydrogenedentota bacterium]